MIFCQALQVHPDDLAGEDTSSIGNQNDCRETAGRELLHIEFSGFTCLSGASRTPGLLKFIANVLAE